MTLRSLSSFKIQQIRPVELLYIRIRMFPSLCVDNMFVDILVFKLLDFLLKR